MPALYINIDRGQDSEADVDPQPKKDDSAKKDAAPHPDRFRIIRLEAKGDKRVVGEIKVAVYGKISQDAKFVATTSQPMSGGWVKVTPTESLPNGEYAVVEMLGKEGMNLYVWDFGVNPNARRTRSLSSRILPACNPILISRSNCKKGRRSRVKRSIWP